MNCWIHKTNMDGEKMPAMEENPMSMDGGMSMQMSFDLSCQSTVLFDRWQIKNCAGMAGSVVS